MNRTRQVIVFTGPVRAYAGKVVRDVQPFGESGRLHGWVRHDRGDWVVRLAGGHHEPNVWEIIMDTVSVKQLRGGR